MNIHITSYHNGKISYMFDHVPSEMVVTESMMKDTFAIVDKVYPMILGLVNEQLVILIDKYHQLQNHIAIDFNTQDLYLEYRGL